MDDSPQETAQHLAAIVASRPLWHRARLSTIMVWPTIRGDWHAILSYAHYTTLQQGETAPPDNNVTYPRDTDHAWAFDGETVEAILMEQVRELERSGEVGHLTVNRIPEPPGTPLGSPPTTGWTILTHSGSDAERRAWQRHIGQEPL